MLASPSLRCVSLFLAFFSISRICHAQDLSPRAYIITPIHSNAIVLAYTFENGNVLLNPTLPISNAKGQLHIPVFSYFHSFSFFGRTASIAAGVPYAVGHFRGEESGLKFTAPGYLTLAFDFP